jgi:hypothetical protein
VFFFFFFFFFFLRCWCAFFFLSFFSFPSAQPQPHLILAEESLWTRHAGADLTRMLSHAPRHPPIATAEWALVNAERWARARGVPKPMIRDVMTILAACAVASFDTLPGDRPSAASTGLAGTPPAASSVSLTAATMSPSPTVVAHPSTAGVTVMELWRLLSIPDPALRRGRRNSNLHSGDAVPSASRSRSSSLAMTSSPSRLKAKNLLALATSSAGKGVTLETCVMDGW